MTREELKRNLNVDVSWWEESCYDEAMIILDKYLDEFENHHKVTKNDFVFTNCNDCKHKINGFYQEECMNCKRYYACHFEKKEINENK